jgi:hypothetical protein
LALATDEAMMDGSNPYSAPHSPLASSLSPRELLSARMAAQLLAAVGLGAVVVAAPLPINFAALILWAVLVGRWVKARARARGGQVWAVELGMQLATMAALILAAAAAPGKVVDRVKARRVALPRLAMTVAELREPLDHGLTIPRFYSISAPDDLAGEVVRFPRADPTIREFIAAIESQTPLRHRFHHCGNGWTILWGGDCSFGVFFRVP